MTRPSPNLRVVPADEPLDTTEFRRALSAACGKRVNDDMRAEIGGRDWSRVHIAGDRARPLMLPAGWKAPR